MGMGLGMQNGGAFISAASAATMADADEQARCSRDSRWDTAQEMAVFQVDRWDMAQEMAWRSRWTDGL